MSERGLGRKHRARRKRSKGKLEETRRTSSVKTLHQEEPPPLPVQLGCQLNRSEKTDNRHLPGN